MGTRFRKSIKIAPGVKLNVSKKSVGVSVGNKFGGMSFNSKNGARTRASLPGTGISYGEKVGSSSKSNAVKAKAAPQSNEKKPLFQRTWFIVVAVLFVLGSFSQFSEDVGFAFFMLAAGAIMGVLSFLSFKESKAKAAGENEQIENEENTED